MHGGDRCDPHRAFAAGIYDQLERQGIRLMDGLSAVFEDAGIDVRIQGVPTIFHLAFGVTEPITNYRDSLQADKPRYRRFTTALLQRGVRALERGAWFVCASHTDALIDRLPCRRSKTLYGRFRVLQPRHAAFTRQISKPRWGLRSPSGTWTLAVDFNRRHRRTYRLLMIAVRHCVA